MIKKATPAQNQLPVSNQITIATMAAGKKNRKTLTRKMIIMKPMIKRTTNAITSRSGGKEEIENIGFIAKFLRKPSILKCVILKF